MGISIKGIPMDRPVHLTIDEARLIVDVANYAVKRLGQHNLWSFISAKGRLRSVLEMAIINSKPFFIWPLRRSISRDDLEFIAPYIDEWINGQAPPQDLPAEYWDWRPETLSAFKKRMQQEGL
jgi:hypothetical protein